MIISLGGWRFQGFFSLNFSTKLSSHDVVSHSARSFIWAAPVKNPPQSLCFCWLGPKREVLRSKGFLLRIPKKDITFQGPKNIEVVFWWCVGFSVWLSDVDSRHVATCRMRTNVESVSKLSLTNHAQNFLCKTPFQKKSLFLQPTQGRLGTQKKMDPRKSSLDSSSNTYYTA